MKRIWLPSLAWKGGLLFLSGAVLYILTLSRQSRITNFGCEICADKAGYYMYLPAAFTYGFHAKNYPDSLDIRHGQGFTLDYQKDRVISKFTCGVAILQTPFYLVANGINHILKQRHDPYSKFYLYFINLGAVFYLCLGLLFLSRFLQFYFPKKTAIISSVIMLAGTNLYYYTVDEPLMSHLYSFVLFSASLCSYKKFLSDRKTGSLLLLSFCLSLAILIRPTNVLFVIILLFLDISSLKQLFRRVVLFLNPSVFIPFFIILAGIFMPQFFYWHYNSGHWIYYSYQGEGFTNWKHPYWLEVLFSPQSGLIPYTPLFLLILAVIVVMIIRKAPNGILLLATFILVTYMCASWHNWAFGVCNFGKRPFVEYLPLFAIPVARFVQQAVIRKNRIKAVIRFVVLGVFILYNVQLTHAFNTCFTGDTWDWQAFRNLLESGNVLFIHSRSYTFFDRYERARNKEFRMNRETIVRCSNAYSGRHASLSDAGNPYSAGFIGNINHISRHKIKVISASAKLQLLSGQKTVLLVFEVHRSDSVVFWESTAIRMTGSGKKNWQTVSGAVSLPALQPDDQVRVYFWNPGKDSLYIDNLQVLFH